MSKGCNIQEFSVGDTSVRDGLTLHPISLPILLEEICRPIPGLQYIAHRHMNVEIGAEAALFPEKEFIGGIFVAVYLASQTKVNNNAS